MFLKIINACLVCCLAKSQILKGVCTTLYVHVCVCAETNQHSHVCLLPRVGLHTLSLSFSVSVRPQIRTAYIISILCLLCVCARVYACVCIGTFGQLTQRGFTLYA